MQRTAILLVLVLALSAVPGLAADGPAQDDASSGADAPDDAANAYYLPAEGTYDGNLTPPDDSDWFALDGPSTSTEDPTCVEAHASGAAIANVTLMPTGPGTTQATTHRVEAPLLPDDDLGLAVTTLFPGDPHVGFDPLVLPSENGTAVSAGTYDLTLRTMNLTDVGTSSSTSPLQRDGPLWEAASGAEEVSDPCFGGTLSSVDPTDRYTVEPSPGQVLVVSYVDDEEDNHVHGTLTLEDPDGNVVETLHAGDIARVPVDVNTSGSWTLTAAGDGVSLTYLGSVSVFDEWPPCRPSC